MKHQISNRLRKLETHERPRRLCECVRTFDYRDALDALAGLPQDDTCPLCGLSRGWIPIVLCRGYPDDVDTGL